MLTWILAALTATCSQEPQQPQEPQLPQELQQNVVQPAPIGEVQLQPAPALQQPSEPPQGQGEPAPGEPSSTEAAATLRRAEKDGKSTASAEIVLPLIRHSDAAIAARAVWLLGEWQAKEAAPEIGQLLLTHGNAGLRLQALAALDRMRDPSSNDAIARATSDEAVAVRALAAQALVRRGVTVAENPLLALLQAHGKERTANAPTDVAAALVALHDLGAKEHLLTAAAAVRFTAPETGIALAFLFQGLSPELEPHVEATTLAAVLDHAEPLLRRYAIQRLGELRNPATASALESRLGVENAELEPLIRLSLQQARGTDAAIESDLAERAKANALAIGRMVERQWNRMGPETKLSAGGAAAVVALGVFLILVARRRTKHAEAAREALAMVAPSAPAPRPQPARAGWRTAPRMDGNLTEEEQLAAGNERGSRY